MARPRFLMLCSAVFVFIAAASLCAADAKQAKQSQPKQAKALVAKAALHHPDDDDPFGEPEKGSGPAARGTPHHGHNPFAASEKHAVSLPKKPRPVPKALRPWENVARIEAALASPTEVCFVEAPLTEVLDYLKNHHQIEIQIDSKALEDAGVGTDVPVTIDLKGISLRSALNLMLRKLNLTWLIEDEVLLITIPEEAEQHLETKVYDVADLVVCRDEHDVISEDYDSLIDVITSTIKPTSWDDMGGPGSAVGESLGTAKVLVVSQTREAQDEIAKLLADIREVAKKTPHASLPRCSKPAEKAGSGRRAQPSSCCRGSSAAQPAAGAAPQGKQPSQPEKPKGKEGGKGMF